jgi:hypothetical protein
MRVTIITTCTDRKRSGGLAEARASDLRIGSLEQLAREWQSALSTCVSRQPARALYSGRSFREAEAAALAARGRLLVISAGMGLVDAGDLIPRYDLTLARGAEGDIAARCCARFDPARWWEMVNRGSANSIARDVRDHDGDIFVIGLSSTYARLVERDLLSLSDSERERLRLVGPALDRNIAEGLRSLVLPYDSRLDGPGSSYSGTLSDFASRAARHFVVEVFSRLPRAGLTEHALAVTQALSAWEAPQRPSRMSMTDDRIVGVIVAALPKVGRNSARMLRHLRDECAIACEQKRFSTLYKRAIQGDSR